MNRAPTHATRPAKPKANGSVTDRRLERYLEEAVVFGGACIPFGPGPNDTEGWHAPGGGFTTQRQVAEQWALQISKLIGQLDQQHAA